MYIKYALQIAIKQALDFLNLIRNSFVKILSEMRALHKTELTGLNQNPEWYMKQKNGERRTLRIFLKKPL